MASGPNTLWQIDRETLETVSDLIFWGSKITADGDCSHEIKRRLLLGRKVMTNLDSVFKIRDITLPTKVCLVKARVFPVVMNGCDSWTTKKAERWRMDAFELWFWRRLLRVPWPARRPKQSMLKEISPECSLEGLMLKLKFQYFGHMIQRADSLEKSHWYWERRKEEKGMIANEMVGWHHWLSRHKSEQTQGNCKGLGSFSPWGFKELDKTEWLSNNNMLEGSLQNITFLSIVLPKMAGWQTL